MKENTLVIHGCGGAGFTQVYKMVSVLKSLGDGYSKVKNKYLDTTDKNARYVNVPRESVYLFKDDSISSRNVDGSGGERRHNFDVITSNMEKYIQSMEVEDNLDTDWHIVVYSAGGGSGSVIGPILHRILLVKNANVISIVIGDTSTAVLSRNTLNTLKTLHNISKTLKKPVIIHYNNNVIDGMGYKESISAVNSDIINFTAGFSLFVSGKHYSVDNTDVKVLLDYTHLSSMGISPDLSEIKLYNNTVGKTEEEKPVVVLTLTEGDISPDTGLDFVPHWKYGKIADNTNIDKDKLPIHIAVSKLGLSNTLSKLDTKVKNDKEMLSKLAESTIEITSNNDEMINGDIVL